MPDDSSSRFISPRDLLLLSRSLSRRADALLRAAHDLALARADALLDACGIRRSLSGFNTLRNALLLYLDVDTRSLCRRSYKSVVRTLALSSRASEAWTDHQMLYALRDAQNAGRFRAFSALLRDRLGRVLSADALSALSAHDFLSCLRSLLCLDALSAAASPSLPLA